MEYSGSTNKAIIRTIENGDVSVVYSMEFVKMEADFAKYHPRALYHYFELAKCWMLSQTNGWSQL
jgi:hypothetical protein